MGKGGACRQDGRVIAEELHGDCNADSAAGARFRFGIEREEGRKEDEARDPVDMDGLVEAFCIKTSKIQHGYVADFV